VFSQKVLVIGLDGATFDLIDPLIAQGKLPTLASLVQSGARGSLRSTIPSHSGPAWTSFATGMGPGRHGIYSFFQRDYSSYTYPPVNSRLVRGETLWQILSQMGRKVGVINVPGTFPPTPVNGFMITGMLSPGLEQAFYPPALREQVLKRAPDYSVEALTLSDKAEYLEKVKRSIEARKKAALYLLDQYPTDLFVIIFTELDRLQHFFWADMDPNHPAHSPSTSPDLSRAIETGYIALDQAVKELLEAVGQEALVLVMSDHGFEGVYKLFYVNKWLADHGYLVLRERHSGSAVQHTKETLQKLGLWRLARRARNLIPRAARLRAENLSYAIDIDWTRTRAAFGPNLGININLRGRESKGVVSPGQEYEELCGRLQRELESYVDPETGERVVDRVLRREEVYAGDAVELAPDLRFVMAKSSTYRGQYAYSPKVNASQPLAYPDKVYGNHAEYGILLVSGPGVRTGVQLNDAQIIDIAPTILYAMGLSIPETVDGRPLKEMFENAFIRAQERGEESPSDTKASPAIGDSVFSGDEEKQVLERLRNLGYLD
jgi:predicted AlkP superfamily phosphohydrolase/phosphomutase